MAQPEAVGWTGASRAESGDCGSGAIVDVVEQAGVMTLKFRVSEMRDKEVTVELAPDGSAITEFHAHEIRRTQNLGHVVKNENRENFGSVGHIILEVPAGRGKRRLLTSEAHGACRWVWDPR